MKKIFLVILILNNLVGFSQKFVVENNDTIKYSDDYNFLVDDVYFNFHCNSFVIKDSELINLKQNCKRIGYWEFKYENSFYSGTYNRYGIEEGVWKTYNENNDLIKETEYVSFWDKKYLLKQTLFENNKGTVVIEKNLAVKFIYSNFLVLFLILCFSLFIRPFLNTKIYNDINGTEIHPLTGDYSQRAVLMFTFWWNIKKLDPKLKSIAKLSNTFSVISLFLFFGILFTLGISGELK